MAMCKIWQLLDVESGFFPSSICFGVFFLSGGLKYVSFFVFSALFGENYNIGLLICQMGW